MRITRSFVPNLFTLANLFMGFSAIVYISKGEFTQAAIFILIASIFDMLDGAVARLLHATSDLGIELDSLCDAISFGVAPSYMLYQVYFYQFNDLGILLAALPALAGVLRLARFNVLATLEDKEYFQGLPIPTSALTILSYLVFFHLSDEVTAEYKTYLIFFVTIATSITMVSLIKFDNLPRMNKKSFKLRPFFTIVFFIAAIVALISKGFLVFPIMVLYIVFSSARHLYYYYKQTQEADDEFDEGDEANEQNLFDI